MEWSRILVFLATGSSVLTHSTQTCGTPFTDVFSSSTQSDVVIEAELVDSSKVYHDKSTYYASFEISKVYKASQKINKNKPVKIGTFTERVSDNSECIFGKLQAFVKYIFFLRNADDGGHYELSAFPVQWNRKIERELRNFLCSPENFLEAPVVRATESVKNGEFRKDMTIECRSEGFPVPLMRWLYKGKVVKPKKHYQITNKKHESILTLLRASHNRHGQYTCEAYNIMGSSNATIQVNVQLYNSTIQSDHSVPCPAHMDNNYCFHNATCQIIVYTGMRNCKCRTGFTGLRCENYWDYDEVKSKTLMDSMLKMDLKLQLLIVLPVVVAMLLIALVIALVAFLKINYKQKKYLKANQQSAEL